MLITQAFSSGHTLGTQENIKTFQKAIRDDMTKRALCTTLLFILDLVLSHLLKRI